MNVAVRELQTIFDAGTLSGLSDPQLLERFVNRREEAVFEVIVRRHGPMVWGVCRRILRDHHDAEDAFQATFLVLTRKAALVMVREKLGNWLYGVAYRTAMKSKAMRAKRRAREAQVTDMPGPTMMPDELRRDLADSLDQELSRLPAKYRIPLVLCELEGLSHKEAASQLGWPIGTISSRLSRGRALLAKRLTRQVASLSVGSLAVLLARESASAGMPARLIGSTAQAATLFAAGGAGTVPAHVATLAMEVIKAMLISKIRISTGILLAVLALAAGGTGRAYQAQTAKAPQRPSKPAPDVKDVAGDKTLKEAVETFRQKLIQNGKAEYAALISEQRVRQAARSAIAAYEAHLDQGKVSKAQKEYFLRTVKPRYVQIIDEGTWPPNCSFSHFHTLVDTVGKERLRYDGFWVRLQVKTPNQELAGFDLPIIDLAYGHCRF